MNPWIGTSSIRHEKDTMKQTERCPKCSSQLILNEKLTKRYVESTTLKVSLYYCGSCVDEIYFLYEGKLFTSGEWKSRARTLMGM